MKIDFNTLLLIGERPKRLEGSNAWIGHIPFSFFITELIRPKVIVELGTHTGNSFCALVQAVNYLSLDTKCYAIDTWEGDPHAGYYGESVFQELQEYLNSNYKKNIKLLRKTFDDALADFEDKSIDILHIDGLHTYSAVKHDFETWEKKVSDRGIILFHDTNVFFDGFGVHKFWSEIKDSYPHVEFYHSNGLGVLGYGHKLDQQVIEFISQFNNDPNYIKLFELFAANIDNIHSLKFQEAYIESKISKIKNSRSYRIGHIIISPLSKLKKMFKKTS